MSANELEERLLTMARAARSASRELCLIPAAIRSEALKSAANAIITARDAILSANEADTKNAEAGGMSPALLDRLLLTEARLNSMASAVASIAEFPDPIGVVLDETLRPNGLVIKRVSVPIGVLGVIYESRPNVTSDAAALCLRSANAVILRSGSEALNSSRAIISAIQSAYRAHNIPEGALSLVDDPSREAVGHILGGLEGRIDLIIPRGGKSLVARVQSEAKTAVLAHLEGLNHTYIHQDADLDMATDIIINAKMRRPGVCGATETLIVDEAIANSYLSLALPKLLSLGCLIKACALGLRISSEIKISGISQANGLDFATEYSAPILNLKIVEGLEEALEHITQYGTGHTEAIITNNTTVADQFLTQIDAAIVMHNTSTQFADGGEFGLGAEIGIATGRLHARGPVGARELTTYRYQVHGKGQIRPL
jgi:glutamate-5-semialdehyde dehydrogenase